MILLIAGLILSTLYRDNTERAFDQRLLVYANTLASNLVGPGDPDRELGPIGDPRFELPLSGWYWQVGAARRGAGEIRSSNRSSAASCRTSPPATIASARSAAATARRPTTAPYASSSATSTSARTDAYIIRVAGPADEIDAAVRASSSRSPSPSRFSAWRWASRRCCRSASACALLANLRSALRRHPPRRGGADRAASIRTTSRRSRASSTSCSTPTGRSWSAPARRSAISPTRSRRRSASS